MIEDRIKTICVSKRLRAAPAKLIKRDQALKIDVPKHKAHAPLAPVKCEPADVRNLASPLLFQREYLVREESVGQMYDGARARPGLFGDLKSMSFEPRRVRDPGRSQIEY